MEPKQKCYVCGKDLKQLTKHLAKNFDCMENYPIFHLHRLRKRSAAIANLKRLKNKNLKRRLNYDPVAKSIRNRQNYEKHQRITKRAKYQQNKKTLKDAMQTFHSVMFQNFFDDIKFGPIFPCVCCHRSLFLRGVKEFDNLIKKTLKNASLDRCVTQNNDFVRNGKMYLCSTCYRTLTTKMEMPKLCHLNGLQLSKVPTCLQLTSLGNQLLAKNLVFIKIRKTPKTRMDLMNDRVS